MEQHSSKFTLLAGNWQYFGRDMSMFERIYWTNKVSKAELKIRKKKNLYLYTFAGDCIDFRCFFYLFKVLCKFKNSWLDLILVFINF